MQSADQSREVSLWRAANPTLVDSRFGAYSTSEAINAGLDLEMPGLTRWRGGALTHAITSNKISVASLNDRVCAVLKIVQQASG